MAAVTDLIRQGAARLVEENKAELANVKSIIDSLKRIHEAGGLPEVGGRAWSKVGRLMRGGAMLPLVNRELGMPPR